MELALLIYIITLLPQVTNFIAGLSVILGVIIVCLGSLWLANIEEPTYRLATDIAKQRETIAKVNPWFKKFVSWIIVLQLINIAIPSERTAYMMVGAYAAQTVAQSEAMGKVLTESGRISNKILTIINGKLDTYVDEAIKEVDKETSITK